MVRDGRKVTVGTAPYSTRTLAFASCALGFKSKEPCAMDSANDRIGTFHGSANADSRPVAQTQDICGGLDGGPQRTGVTGPRN